jgi:hypothetical protein
MKRALAIAAGLTGGLLLAGILASTLIITLPPRLRGEPIVLAAAVIVIAVTTTYAVRSSSGKH